MVPLGGCVVAIGPRYTVESQKLELTYPSGSPQQAEVHASYRLRNTGNGAVENFDLDMPDPQHFRLQDVAIHWAGYQVQQRAVGNSEFHFEFPLNTKWEVGARNDLDVSYRFQTVRGEAPPPGAEQRPFLLVGAGWYPELRPTVGAFASIGSIPKHWDLVLHLPQEFQVHAGGNPSGHSQKAGESVYRFSQALGGRQPYVVAGAFAHQEMNAGGLTISFWSESPATADRARDLGQRISAANAYFTKEFGPRIENPSKAWVIECPQRVGAIPDIPWLVRSNCMTLPGAVVVPEGFLSAAQSTTAGVSTHVHEALAAQFASSWLYGMSYPIAGAPLFPMAGAPSYAAFALDSSRAPNDRQAAVEALIQQVPPVSPASGTNRPKTLGAVSRDDPAELRNAALIKSELFYIALEDRCGANHLHRAITRMRRILRHEPWTANDLRSAVEAECGADLGPFFRSWLDAPDIPEDFRARYSGAALKPGSQETK